MGVDPDSFGLYYTSGQDVKVLPLENIHIKTNIVDSVARVEYSQVYRNNTEDTLHIYYLFPIPPNACFDSFTAKYKSFTVEGQIQKKKAAKQRYSEAISDGKTAAYAEIMEETNDVMKLIIGNMEPDTSITICLSFVEQLEISCNKLWRYHILGCLQPKKKYEPVGDATNEEDDSIIPETNQNEGGHVSIETYPFISSKNQKAYHWTIEVEIESQSKINFVNSPGYKLQVTKSQDELKASIKLDPSEKFTPSKDFTLYYSNEEVNKPKTYVTKYDNEYCAMINFVPETSTKTLNDAYLAELESQGVKLPDVDLENTKGEYIFLIDRSGSMSGSFIKMAREALAIFLRSLPKDSYFNVISFGSKYTTMFEESKKGEGKVLSEAIDNVEQFDADMAGTEILKPLKWILQQTTPKNGYSRKVYLLTDGAVGNTNSVFKFVKDNVKDTRIFTVGIGSGCSKALIKGVAQRSKGLCEYVESSDKLSEKVISLLMSSIQTSFYDFEIEFPQDSKLLRIVPMPKEIGMIYEDHFATIFAFFDEKAEEIESTQFRLTYSQSNQTERITSIIDVDFTETLDDSHPLSYSISKLGYHKLIKCIEENPKKILYNGTQKYTENDIPEISENYGILSKYTAFVTVLKDENDKIKSTNQTEILVPVLQDSYDEDEEDENTFKVKSRPTAVQSRGRGSTLSYPRSRSAAKQTATKTKTKAKARKKVAPPTIPTLSKSRSRSREKMPALQKKKAKKSKVEATEKILDEEEDDYDDDEDASESEEEKVEIDVTKTLKRRKESPVAKKKPPVATGPGYDDVYSVISKQDIDEGSWKKVEQVASIIKVDIKKFKDIVGKQFKGLEVLALTALVMFWLQNNCQKFKGTWILIFRKAENFLDSKGKKMKDFAAIKGAFAA